VLENLLSPRILEEDGCSIVGYSKLMVRDMGSLCDHSVYSSLPTCSTEAYDHFVSMDNGVLNLVLCHYGWQAWPTIGGCSLCINYSKTDTNQPLPVGFYSRNDSSIQYDIEVHNVEMICGDHST